MTEKDNTAQNGRRTRLDPERHLWAWVPSLCFTKALSHVIVIAIALVFYKQMGLSNAEITFYISWLYLPWILKPYWSPFLQLHNKRRWILTMQLLIGAALAGVAFTIPADFWLQSTLCLFFLIALSSAAHDVTADTFCIKAIDKADHSIFMGIRSTFYCLATIFGQGILIMTAGNLQIIFRNSIQYSWSLTFYGVTGLFIGLWLYHNYILPKTTEDLPQKDCKPHAIVSEIRNAQISFFNKPQAWTGLCFMLFFCMPKGLLSQVSALFLIDAAHNGGLGLSPQEYGLAQGTVGGIGLTLGGILGSIVISENGLKKWLWPMACAITLPDIVYVYLSYSLTDSLSIINICIFLEQLGYGFGLTACMRYLSYYSQGREATRHYTMCKALMIISFMLPCIISGTLQEMMGYRTFFIMVMFFCAITFIVSAFLKITPTFGQKNTKEKE